MGYGHRMDEQNRNLILAVVLSGIVMVVWMTFFAPAIPDAPPPTAPVSAQTTADATVQPEPQSESVAALEAAPRIQIDTPRLKGSISTLGGRIDQLELVDYRVSLEPNSDLVSVFKPEGSDYPYYAGWGWWAPDGGYDTALLPGSATEFKIDGNARLTPETPVKLVWDNGQGLIFHRVISIDADYLFTIEQTVQNTTDSAVELYPFGVIYRRGLPQSSGVMVRHEGLVRHGDGTLEEMRYAKIPDLDVEAAEGTHASTLLVKDSGWTGFTDSFWMSILAPPSGSPFRSVVRYDATKDLYQVRTDLAQGFDEAGTLQAMSVAPGETITSSSFLFAGAKEYDVIRAYQRDPGLANFIDSIDWGWFFFLTKPMFAVLHWLNVTIGNMGWAIIGLTVFIKTLVFPLSYKSYVSMARMKELQPEMEKLKERVGGDRAKMQQEMMALYKREKVNPASGCLPILIQIPIFFSLYKVINVTTELYHAPWILWIKDLSAPDPTSILNLFGLLPWAAPEAGSLIHIISLGVLPIILGLSMWLQQKLNPAPTDATQAAIFAWMPWVFMFTLGGFASGLVLYWIANNTLTFIQQYSIMWRHGKRPDIFGNIFSARAKPK